MTPPTPQDMGRARAWAGNSAAICVLDERLREIAASQYAQAIADERERCAKEYRESGVRGALTRVSFNDAEGVVYLDVRSGTWKRLLGDGSFEPAVDAIMRALADEDAAAIRSGGDHA